MKQPLREAVRRQSLRCCGLLGNGRRANKSNSPPRDVQPLLRGVVICAPGQLAFHGVVVPTRKRLLPLVLTDAHLPGIGGARAYRRGGAEWRGSTASLAEAVLRSCARWPDAGDGWIRSHQKKSAEKKGSGNYVPIIALTAHARQGDKERFLACGMDGYVSKPIKLQELFAVIANVVPNIHRSAEAKDLILR